MYTVIEALPIWERCSSAERRERVTTVGISNAKLLIHIGRIAGFGHAAKRCVFLINQLPAFFSGSP